MSNGKVFFESGPIRLSWDVISYSVVEVLRSGKVIGYSDLCDYKHASSCHTIGYTGRIEVYQMFYRPQPKPEPLTLPKEVWDAVELLHGPGIKSIAMDSTGETRAFYGIPSEAGRYIWRFDGKDVHLRELYGYCHIDDWRNSLVVKPETCLVDLGLVPEKVVDDQGVYCVRFDEPDVMLLEDRSGVE